MNLPRRKFLGSSLVVLGSTLVEALTIPLWRWKRPLLLDSQTPNGPEQVQCVDVAKQAGLNIPNVWGSDTNKRYIIEAKGSGIAFFRHARAAMTEVPRLLSTFASHTDSSFL
jgi:hypothetical protein